MDYSRKILFYSPTLYPCTIGGMEIYNFFLINELSAKFHFAKWFVLTECPKYSNNNVNILKGNSRLLFLRRFGLGTISNIIYVFLFKKFNWKDIDLVFLSYTHSFNFNVIGFILLKFFFNVDYIVYIHDGSLKHWQFPWLQRLFFRKAKKIAGVSKSIIKEYEKRGINKIKLIYPLIPFSKSEKKVYEIKLNFNLVKFKKIVLFVGSLKELKDPFYVLESINKIKKEILIRNGIGFVFAGDGPLMNNLESLSKKYSLEPFISFLGRVPNNLIKDLYKISEIFIISSNYEGTPIALIEAMFNRLICIGSDVDGINSLIVHNKNGLLFDKTDPHSLHLILEDVLINTERYKHLGINAANTFHKIFNYDTYIKNMCNWIISG